MRPDAQSKSKKARAKASAASRAKAVFHMDDGDVLRLPALDVEAAKLLQHAALALSEDPQARARGRALLRQAAELILRERIGKHNLQTSQAGRPKGKKKPDEEVSDRELRRRKATRPKT